MIPGHGAGGASRARRTRRRTPRRWRWREVVFLRQTSDTHLPLHDDPCLPAPCLGPLVWYNGGQCGTWPRSLDRVAAVGGGIPDAARLRTGSGAHVALYLATLCVWRPELGLQNDQMVDAGLDSRERANERDKRGHHARPRLLLLPRER